MLAKAEDLNRKGLDLMNQGNLEEAVIAFRSGIEADPGYPNNHLDSGAVLRLLGRRQEAIEALRSALTLQPDWSNALYNLGMTLLEDGDLQGSAGAFRDAVTIDEGFSLGHGGLGLSLMYQRDLSGAKSCFQRALALDPGLHMASHFLGMAYWLCDEADAAVSTYRQSLSRDPLACRDCHLGLGMALLATGDYAGGWSEYEWRWDCQGGPPHLLELDAPFWNGEPLKGKTIVLWPEQGLGDILMFIRFATAVHDLGATVWVLSRPNLDRLLATCPGVARVVSRREELGAIDFQIPLASLPGVLGIGLADLPGASVPYLMPPERLARDPFGPRRGDELRVGVVWGVEPGQPNWQARSCPLPAFRALERVPGVELYSLQFGSRRAELRQTDAPRMADLSAVLGDFAGTAALVEHLDLVITVDTSMAHLAGAIGKPVWTLLPSDSDWRWLRGRDDSPWYPTMRLFRQQEKGCWDSVMERVSKVLLLSSFQSIREARRPSRGGSPSRAAISCARRRRCSYRSRSCA